MRVLILLLLTTACTTTVGGITCRADDQACKISRIVKAYQEEKARQPPPPPPPVLSADTQKYIEDVTRHEANGYSLTPNYSSPSYSSGYSEPSRYVIRPSPTQVWLQSGKLNSMINPQGRIYEVVPVR